MINVIWVLLLSAGIINSALQGRIDTVTASAINAADGAVSLSFKLIGVMCLWMGIMKIAEKAEIIKLLAKLLDPIIGLIFPSIPKRHPAIGAIVMTLSANLLGLGNAVTPLGIKAMQELQKLNPQKDTASEAMCTLLALCTAGLTLVPATIIALRAAAGSQNPGETVGATLLVSFMATFVVLVADFICRFLYKLRGRR